MIEAQKIESVPPPDLVKEDRKVPEEPNKEEEIKLELHGDSYIYPKEIKKKKEKKPPMPKESHSTMKSYNIDSSDEAAYL